jgi:hypothetical protein
MKWQAIGIRRPRSNGHYVCGRVVLDHVTEVAVYTHHGGSGKWEPIDKDDVHGRRFQPTHWLDPMGSIYTYLENELLRVVQ